MRDVDIRELLGLIPNRHIAIAFGGAIPFGMGLMGFFAPSADGSLGWLAGWAVPLMIFGGILGLPLYWSSARAALIIRRRMDEESTG